MNGQTNRTVQKHNAFAKAVGWEGNKGKYAHFGAHVYTEDGTSMVLENIDKSQLLPAVMLHI